MNRKQEQELRHFYPSHPYYRKENDKMRSVDALDVLDLSSGWQH